MPKINIYNGIKRPQWKIKNIDRKIREYFAKSIFNARQTYNINIKFDQSYINDPQHLTRKIAKNYLENKEDTLSLFKKAIDTIVSVNMENLDKGLEFTLDLVKLTPKYLKRYNLNGLAKTFQKSNDYAEGIKFLYGINALDIEGLKVKPQRVLITQGKNQQCFRFIANQPTIHELVYPESF